jgi:hypothetical protein
MTSLPLGRQAVIAELYCTLADPSRVNHSILFFETSPREAKVRSSLS